MFQEYGLTDEAKDWLVQNCQREEGESVIEENEIADEI
jgi:hypothetical protein